MQQHELCPSRVRELLGYNVDTGVFVWLKSRRPSMVGREAGCIVRVKGKKVAYRHIEVLGCRVLAHRLAWFHVHGVWPPRLIDHRNGDGLDNRLDNLRLATVAESNQSRTSAKRNRSGMKGVSWLASRRKWYVAIRAHGKSHYVGTFSDLRAAKEACLNAVQELHGEFARTNEVAA